MIYSKMLAKFILSALTLSLLAACGGGDSDSSVPQEDNTETVFMDLSGSVGDGPITGATITFEGDNGLNEDSATSDGSATYQTNLELKTSQFPLVIKATGGTDMVTRGAPDFTLYSVVVSHTQQRISNINPHSTLITRTAQYLEGGITRENISTAQEAVLRIFSFGLDPRVIYDPIETIITADNAANISKSSEVLGEMIRRIRDALITAGVDVSGDDVVDALAADLVDGKLDGVGAEQANRRIAALASFISGQVLLEAAANRLVVNNVVATTAMDAAITATRPTENPRLTGDVVITAEMLAQIKALANSAASLAPLPALDNIINQLSTLSGDQPPSEFVRLFSLEVSGAFVNIIQQAASATETELDAMNRAVNLETRPNEPGRFEFDAANYSVNENGGTVEITINRVNGNDGIVTIDWMTQGVTATFAQDYGNFNWTGLTFADGETSKIETISIVNDDIVEDNEVFNVLLGNPTGGASLGSAATAAVTIINDDTAPEILSVLSTTPFDQAYAIQLSGNIIIEFDSTIDCQTVNEQVITLVGNSGNEPFFITCSGAMVTIDPEENFAASSAYTVTVSAGIVSVAGRGMADSHSWSFTTLAGQALPMLSEWESNMLVDGEKWGQYLTNLHPALGTYNEQTTTYYDSQRVFYQIAEYTGEQEPWHSYALEAKRIYLNYAENSPTEVGVRNFGFPGYRRFSQGIYMEYALTGDSAVFENIAKIRDNPAISEAGSRSISIPIWYYERRSREVAYALDAHIFAERAGYVRDEADVARYVTMALNHIKEWASGEFGDAEMNRRSPFMFALTAEALIKFYVWELENYRDPKALYNHSSVPVEFIPTMSIPDAIKLMADYFRDEAVVRSGDNVGKPMWVEDIGGRKPNWNDEGGTGYSTFRYEDVKGGAPTIDLNLMIAPIYAWLFQHYSEMKYIEIADQLFISGVTLSNTGWNTKIFNQNYRWSFDYVRWRNEGFAKIN